MKILALDSAGPILGVALSDSGTVVRLIEEDRAFRHVEELVPSIDSLLERQGWSITDLDALAVSGGPGSFTGLRVGTATAKGIALALGVPLYSIDTLHALAYTEYMARKAEKSIDEIDHIVALLDARKGRLYGAIFDAGDCSRSSEDLDRPIEVLLRRIPSSARSGRWVCAGPLSKSIMENYRACPASALGGSAAAGIAVSASFEIERGTLPDDPYSGPRYLRTGDIGTQKRVLRFREE